MTELVRICLEKSLDTEYQDDKSLKPEVVPGDEVGGAEQRSTVPFRSLQSHNVVVAKTSARVRFTRLCVSFHVEVQR
jgi:hypothetical protein